jgi:hypothetical protein
VRDGHVLLEQAAVALLVLDAVAQRELLRVLPEQGHVPQPPLLNGRRVGCLGEEVVAPGVGELVERLLLELGEGRRRQLRKVRPRLLEQLLLEDGRNLEKRLQDVAVLPPRAWHEPVDRRIRCGVALQVPGPEVLYRPLDIKVFAEIKIHIGSCGHGGTDVTPRSLLPPRRSDPAPQ